MKISNKQMKIKKVGENFSEGSFQVVFRDKVLFEGNTNKICVMFIAKNKELKL